MSRGGAVLQIEGDEVRGEVALEIAPGTVAARRDRLLEEALRVPLAAAARALGVVLAAAPSAYARPLPGKDAAGCTRFAVRARVEGERLIPQRRSAPPRR